MPDRIPWRERRLTWRMVVGGLAVAIGVPLAGACAAAAVAGPEPTGPVNPKPVHTADRDDVRVIDVNVKGRTVTCIWADGAYEVALSCDWEAK